MIDNAYCPTHGTTTVENRSPVGFILTCGARAMLSPFDPTQTELWWNFDMHTTNDADLGDLPTDETTTGNDDLDAAIAAAKEAGWDIVAAGYAMPSEGKTTMAAWLFSQAQEQDPEVKVNEDDAASEAHRCAVCGTRTTNKAQVNEDVLCSVHKNALIDSMLTDLNDAGWTVEDPRHLPGFAAVEAFDNLVAAHRRFLAGADES